MQEKTMILEMVKDGKINVDEAVKLLYALNSTKTSPKEEFEQNLHKFSKNMDNFAKDIKYKFNDLAKNDGAKFKENTQNFFNKTGEVIDDFANSLKDLFSPNFQETQNYNQNEFNQNYQNQNCENQNYQNDDIIDQ